MEPKWKRINFEDLEKGQFVIIEYWELERNYILAQVISKTEVNEISMCPHERIYDTENIEKYFPLTNRPTKRTLFLEESFLRISSSGTTKTHVTQIYHLLDPTIVKEMATNKIKETEEKIKKLQEEKSSFEKTMKKIGVLSK